jgi:hypothetical protein
MKINSTQHLAFIMDVYRPRLVLDSLKIVSWGWEWFGDQKFLKR